MAVFSKATLTASSLEMLTIHAPEQDSTLLCSSLHTKSGAHRHVTN